MKNIFRQLPLYLLVVWVIIVLNELGFIPVQFTPAVMLIAIVAAFCSLYLFILDLVKGDSE